MTNSTLGSQLTKILKTISFMEMFSISIKTIPPLMESFFSLDYAKLMSTSMLCKTIGNCLMRQHEPSCHEQAFVDSSSCLILESYDIVCVVSVSLCFFIGSFGNALTQGPYLVLKLFAVN